MPMWPASTSSRNALGNYAAAIWLGMLGLLLIPIYMRLLGPTQWGLIALCMMLQATFSMLDLGLSHIMPRDIAKAQASPEQTQHLYRRFLRLYGLIGAAGWLVGILLLPAALRRWAQLDGAEAAALPLAVTIVLVQFVFQFANNANLGYWNGLQLQNRANLRQCGFASLKHLLALASIHGFASHGALVYLASFAVVSILEFVTNRLTIRAEQRYLVPLPVGRDDLVNLARRSMALSSSVLVGVAASHVDRIAMARILPLEDFGRYSAVVALGLAFLQLQYPVLRALLPRIAVSTGAAISGSRVLKVSLLTAAPCLVAAALAGPILQAWLGDVNGATSLTRLLQAVLTAVAINGIYHVFYLHMLAADVGQLLLKINMLSLLVGTTVLLSTAPSLGSLAGGLCWVAMSSVQLICALIWARARRAAARQ